MLSPIEEPDERFAQLSAWANVVFKVVGFRLLLGIVLTLTLLFTSWHSQPLEATAVTQSSLQMMTSRPQAQVMSAAHYQRSQPPAASETDPAFDPSVANRLSRQGLSHAVLTGNHLTRAHLFTELPR